MTIRTDLSTPYPAKPAAPMGDMAIVRRLVRDYIGHQWGKLAIAGLCMIVASSMTGALAWIIDPAIKKIFLEKDVQMLLIIPLEVVGIIALRAVTSYGRIQFEFHCRKGDRRNPARHVSQPGPPRHCNAGREPFRQTDFQISV